MSPEVVSLLVLLVILVIATVLPINMGALGFGAAFLLGTLVLGMSVDEILAGFPAGLFLTLAGITYLFAIAQINGTVDLLIRGAIRLVGGRIAAIPWIMFAVTALLVGIGALFAVAIVAPIALRFAFRYKINALMMGMMVVHGALGGAFTPISVYGSFVNGLVSDSGLESSPIMLTVAPLAFNAAIGALIFFLLGGRQLLAARTHHHDEAVEREAVEREAVEASAVTGGGPGSAGTAPARGHGVQAAASPEDPAPEARTPAGETDAPQRIRVEQVATIVGLLVFAVLTVVWALDVGFTSILIGVLLALIHPKATKGAVDKIAWSTVLLIAGVLTYVGVLEAAGTIDYISNAIAGLGAPLLAALLICYLGGIASAFASSVAILGVMIPLAIPFLQQGGIGAVGFIVALAIATTVVDVSPFSTNGALVLANAQDIDRDRFYRQMLAYAGIVVVLGPLLAWAVFVLPGWL
ncbi:SLC13 family permease [Modestobacter sp. I12A-02662]|uniref:SLC13 family permease n=1 Tax=Modestobacter sp. I12A-02662 TaxID=1730496 RepID=UPI0034DF8E7F